MASRISDLLGTSPANVNIKATTAEKTGEIGEGKAIASHAVVLLKER
jgi:2C-methyl-D-erythritol 2,4-cyclodiphosphate synthase